MWKKLIVTSILILLIITHFIITQMKHHRYTNESIEIQTIYRYNNIIFLFMFMYYNELSFKYYIYENVIINNDKKK